MHPYRTLLFVPGHKPDWADKAVKAGADAIVLDLEDSVPDAEKAAARRQVRDSIGRLREAGTGAGLLVRVNGLATRLTGADLVQHVRQVGPILRFKAACSGRLPLPAR